jgi:membrane-associated phospholipid phosphatase
LKNRTHSRTLWGLVAVLVGLAPGGAIAAAGPESPDSTAAVRPHEGAVEIVRGDLDRFFSTRTLAILGGGAGLTAASLGIENPDRQAAGLRGSSLDRAADFGSTWGNSATLAGVSLALWTSGKLAGQPRLADAGFQSARAVFYSGAAVVALKLAVRRTRPDGGTYSFPSGHTAAAFAVAPVLAARLGPWAAVPAYGFAAATAMGRLEDRKHYLSDVAFGAALGWSVGLAVAGDHGRRWPAIAMTPAGPALAIRF